MTIIPAVSHVMYATITVDIPAMVAMSTPWLTYVGNISRKEFAILIIASNVTRVVAKVEFVVVNAKEMIDLGYWNTALANFCFKWIDLGVSYVCDAEIQF